MTRYLTRWYVATDPQEAERLARADGTAQFSIAEGVELRHVGPGWALWSDGEVTTSSGLPAALRGVRSLLPAAVDLISGVKLAGGPPPRCAGGYATLAAVVEVLRDDLVETGQGDSRFEPPRWRRLEVRMRDGAKRALWVFEQGLEEGVRFEVGDAWADVGSLLKGVEPRTIAQCRGARHQKAKAIRISH